MCERGEGRVLGYVGEEEGKGFAEEEERRKVMLAF